jgi:acetylglutamate kinase
MRATEPDLTEVILTRAGVGPEGPARLERLRGRVVVVKYGGAAMVSPEGAEGFAGDLVLLHRAGTRPVLVHGGGPELTEVMGRMGLESTWVDGHRVTNAEAAELAEMVLSGRVNKKVVSQLQRAGGRAVGLSGTDGGMVQVGRHRPNGADLGFVGTVEAVDVSLLDSLLDAGYLPVVSSTAADNNGQPHNINADVMTGALAAALRADETVFLTDVPGVLVDGERHTILSIGEVRRLLDDGAASGGMRPKLEAAVTAIRGGVPAVHLIDGRVPHALLHELLSEEGAGTTVTGDGS